MTLKAVIFDWGGVFMQTRDYTPRHSWDARLGLPPGTLEQAVYTHPAWEDAQRGRLPLPEYWARLAQVTPLPLEEMPAFWRDFFSGDAIDQDVVAAARTFKARGLRLGLLSNNIPELHDDLQATGLSTLFDAVVISAEIGVMKPAAAAYMAALDLLSVTPDQAAFMDDAPANIQGAKEVGLQAFLYQPGFDLVSLLEPLL